MFRRDGAETSRGRGAFSDFVCALICGLLLLTRFAQTEKKKPQLAQTISRKPRVHPDPGRSMLLTVDKLTFIKYCKFASPLAWGANRSRVPSEPGSLVQDITLFQPKMQDRRSRRLRALPFFNNSTQTSTQGGARETRTPVPTPKPRGQGGGLRGSLGLRRLRDAPPKGFHFFQKEIQEAI